MVQIAKNPANLKIYKIKNINLLETKLFSNIFGMYTTFKYFFKRVYSVFIFAVFGYLILEKFVSKT